MEEIGKFQNQKVSEVENFRIKKFLNQKVSESMLASESVRIGKCLELEIDRIGK